MYYVPLVTFNSCQKLIPFLSTSGAQSVSGLHTQNRHSVNPYVMKNSAKIV
jgi:hypothetical protein